MRFRHEIVYAMSSKGRGRTGTDDLTHSWRRGCGIAARVLAQAGLGLALGLCPVAAQEGPGAAGRSLGGGPDAEAPGAYASPSAIPRDPATSDIGIPKIDPLKRLEPIALPERRDEASTPPLNLPALPAYAPAPMEPRLNIARPPKALVLNATLGEKGPVIPDQLIWRLFSPLPGPDGKLALVAVARGGEASFDIPAGAYLLHLGFGRAGMTRRIDYSGEQTRETVVLEAGGLRLNATAAPKKPIRSDALRFDIYSAATDGADRRLIASDLPAGEVVRLNAGDYHVVSRYGAVNATVRADLHVEAGRITDATLQHHAAQLTMKLVREPGGEAIADTSWVITSDQGDVVRENIVSAFPSMVLEEGGYVIVARNKERVFQRQFTVTAGENTDVEVLTSDLVDPNDPSLGSGD